MFLWVLTIPMQYIYIYIIKSFKFCEYNCKCAIIKYIQLMDTLYSLSSSPEENRPHFPIPLDTQSPTLFSGLRLWSMVKKMSHSLFSHQFSKPNFQGKLRCNSKMPTLFNFFFNEWLINQVLKYYKIWNQRDVTDISNHRE